jgi:hypothetical protein
VIYEVAAKDLFRSPTFLAALLQHLVSSYPTLPLKMIQKQVFDDGLDYTEMRTNLDSFQATESKASQWFRSLVSGSKNEIDVEKEVINEELRHEIWDYSLEDRLSRTMLDEGVAREYNRNLWISDGGVLIPCECCYADLAIEDLIYCFSGQHCFCRECLNSQVGEQIYGGSPLRLDDSSSEEGGRGSGVNCFATGDCASSFTSIELERALSPALFAALEKRLGEIAVESVMKTVKRERIMRCPFCNYAEVMDDTVLRRAFPLFFLPAAQISTANLVSISLHTLFSFVIFLLLYPVTVVYAVTLPDAFYNQIQARVWKM